MPDDLSSMELEVRRRISRFKDCDICLKLEANYSGYKEFLPPGWTDGDQIYVCSSCFRRWWRYNPDLKLWKHINHNNEWLNLRMMPACNKVCDPGIAEGIIEKMMEEDENIC